ncbi:hypothetical protein ACT80S_06620 [Ramlibacter sp. MAHUQ-53]|uniref:hypothetical protein n=1 Tax=unclassified Ramlibacter TaxID=2617605 RepID=UPI00363B45FA
MRTGNDPLASGWLHALVRRPGSDREDATRGLAGRGAPAAAHLRARGVGPGGLMIRHALPGDVPARVPPGPAGAATTMRCVETGRDLPRVPREWAPAIQTYFLACRVAYDPGNPIARDDCETAGLRDAFREQVDGQPLLPAEITGSSLLNRGVTGPGGAGRVLADLPNTLHDPATGLSASISLRGGTEVVIAFGGTGGQGRWLSQVTQCAINLLGLAPPASFTQAARLTARVQAHLEKLNASLPPQRQLRLSLTGHSMGGGLATYASLRCGVPALVLAPMRLGDMARRSLGPAACARAPSLVTEVCCREDWVAANRLSRLMHWLGMKGSVGAFGTRYLVEVPSRREAACLGTEGADFSPHRNIDLALKIQVAEEEAALRRAGRAAGGRRPPSPGPLPGLDPAGPRR